MIKGIIFDFIGVLTIKSSLRDFCDFYSDQYDLDADRMKKLLINLWLDSRVSNIDTDEFFKQLAKFTDQGSKFETDFVNYFGFRHELYNYIVQELKDNYKLGILTNHIESWFTPIIKDNNLSAIFDVIVTSYDTKIAKPDQRIFKKIIYDLGLASSECIYIDDKLKNIRTATQMSMPTILFENFNQFKTDLKSILSNPTRYLPGN